MGDLPRVSVIIPVRDDPRLTQCLAMIRRQTYPADLIEIIVADNGSAVPFRGVLADEGVRVVTEPAGGSYAARNAAVLASHGTVLAFTDADCLPDESWVEELVAALGAGADVVAGHVAVDVRDDRRPHPVEAYELVHAFPQQVYVQRGGGCVTANMATTRAVFDDTGPFLHELFSGADIEWGQRAHGRGARTVFCRDAQVRHPARDSFHALNSKLRRVIRGGHERDRLAGGATVSPWPTARSLVPPIGAVRRARAPELRTPRARVAFVVGETYHRYAAAWHVLALAIRTRVEVGRLGGSDQPEAR